MRERSLVAPEGALHGRGRRDWGNEFVRDVNVVRRVAMRTVRPGSMK